MPTEHDSPHGWLGACLAAARGADDTGRAAMRAAMAASAEGYDRFRHVVLQLALVRHLRQDVHEVRRLLAVELGRDEGGAPTGAAGAGGDDAEVGEEELLSEGARAGRWPLAELVVLAAEGFDAPRSWEKLVAHAPERPVGFFALFVARYVQSRTRLGGAGAAASEEVVADRGKQHVVAGMLDTLALVDPECGGAIPGAAGVYRAVMARLVEFVAERGGETTYPLRKLFPPHAWPPEAPTARALVAEALLAALTAHHGLRLEGDLAAALGAAWGGAAPSGPRDGLDASAAHHLAAGTFPGWSEVGLWSGAAAPGSPFNPNTLQRQVSRLDDELEPFVARQRERVRRHVESRCP